MIIPKTIVDDIDAVLEPFQPLVIGLMLAVVAVALWACFVNKNPAVRTGLLLWFTMP